MGTSSGPAPAAVSGRARYVAEIAALLWPPPRHVAMGSGAGGTGRPVREYLLVPHAREPRLMLPAAGRPGATAVLGFNKDRSRKANLLSRALAIGLRSGVGGPLLRDRIRVYETGPSNGTAADEASTGPADAPDIEGYLGRVLGAEVTIALHIGPDRANRKPVAQVLARDGRTLGYAKIGVNELTRELVRAERTALETLAKRPMPTVRVPSIAHAGQWNGLEILVLDPLPVWSRHATLSHDRMMAAVAEVAEVDGVERLPLTAAPYWDALRSRATALGTDAAREITAALDRVAERAGDRVLPFGAWHGDWTAWNMAALPDTMLVWDWERFGTGVPVGFDAVHYVTQDAITEGGVDPRRAADEGLAGAPEALAPLGLTPDEATLVALLYLAELGTRYLTDRQDEAGARLGRLDTWLLPVLTSWSDRVG
ncbi:aminoglycoside phosphotransferase [Actinomadura sp. 9N215]|uniref:aminoglycoside phosphotransferase n=1 Tax=Actinomadura sp. 9N215 TaxID=3375150 RepID=UPI0037B6E0C8